MAAPAHAYAGFVANVFRGEVPAAFLSSEGFAKARVGTWAPFAEVDLVDPAALADQIGASHPALPQLLGFLRRGKGGFYALWRREERPWADCPVVYIANPIEGSIVVARTLGEFLTVAAWGLDVVGLAGTAGAPKSASSFFTRRKIVRAEDPVAVLAAAAADVTGLAALLAPAAPPTKKKAPGKKKPAAKPVAEAAVPAAEKPMPAGTVPFDDDANTDELARAVAPPVAPSATAAEAAAVKAPPRSRAAAAVTLKPTPPVSVTSFGPVPTPAATPAPAEEQKKAWWKIW